jgi:hypothetical protein
MTKCETRKQLSYSRLGTGITQENGGLNQVLRCVKPPTCMTVVNSSVILTNEKRNNIRRKLNPQYPNLWKYCVCRFICFCSIFLLIVCHFVPFLMTIELSVLWFTASDYRTLIFCDKIQHRKLKFDNQKP